MTVKLEPLERATHESLLLRFLQENEDFFLECENCEPTPQVAAEFFDVMPSGLAPENKILLGVFAGKRLVAFLEIYKDRHCAREWLVSTMIVSKPWRARGFGKRVYVELEEFMIAQGADVAVLGVVAENATAIHFWQRVGYVDTGIVQAQDRNGISKSIKVFEKRL